MEVVILPKDAWLLLKHCPIHNRNNEKERSRHNTQAQPLVHIM